MSAVPHLNIPQIFDLAVQHHRAGRLSEAEQIYHQILDATPRHPNALHLLGVIAHQSGRHEEAVGLIRRAIALNPAISDYHSNLAVTLTEQGRLDEAIAACRAALALKRDYAQAHYNLGNALKLKGRLDEAIAAYRAALALNPNYAKAHSNLGVALTERGRLDEGVAAYRSALALQPNFAEAHSNLGGALKAQGQLDEAITAYRAALALKPDYAEAHSNLLLALHYHPGYEAAALAEEHRRWNRQHAEPLKGCIEPHPNDRSPERRLRIGYVSPDFRHHPVGRFLLPLLEEHDRKNFEIHAYAQVHAADEMTEQLRSNVDSWHSTIGLSDPQLAGQIRQDGIDILVDLAMHTASSRLLVFARKPAPVQATYLAYCSTTGLDTMDYRISDPYFDPEGCDETVYTEQTFRLPETYWCYQPLRSAPEVHSLPARTSGHVTFGTLNNFCKINDATLGAWAALLAAVPGSQLLLHAREGSHRRRVLDFLARAGVESARVRFVGYVSPANYFEQYGAIDIALDPFPYGGGTTTCDALWMGVPVVTLAGKRAVGRGGVSILSNLGLPDWIAQTELEYVQIAIERANDLPRLAELRSTLRARMQGSPLMDAPRFARNIEAAYRQMWRQWCEA